MLLAQISVRTPKAFQKKPERLSETNSDTLVGDLEDSRPPGLEEKIDQPNNEYGGNHTPNPTG